VQRLPKAGEFYRHYLPLFPMMIETFNLDRYDLVISSSHCAAKSVIRSGSATHVCYCHSPMRYAWDQFDAYFGPARIGPAASRLMRPVMARIARWDRDTAGRADRYVAISHYVAGRIRRYYNREATVVYPPVDTEFFRPASGDSSTPDRSALVVSALVPYKRIDLAIEACRQANVALTIVGDGPDRARLEQSAGSGVRFLGRLPDENVRALYRRSAVTLLPGEEDFGIVPLEAQACGRPVVALARGGSLETVVDGVTGLLVDDPSPSAFADAVARALDHRFDAGVIRAHSERFSRTRFGDEMEDLVHALSS
jgi:glycosyltransferase involved in cell wall biosynthesis